MSAPKLLHEETPKDMIDYLERTLENMPISEQNRTLRSMMALLASDIKVRASRREDISNERKAWGALRAEIMRVGTEASAQSQTEEPQGLEQGDIGGIAKALYPGAAEMEEAVEDLDKLAAEAMKVKLEESPPTAEEKKPPEPTSRIDDNANSTPHAETDEDEFSTQQFYRRTLERLKELHLPPDENSKLEEEIKHIYAENKQNSDPHRKWQYARSALVLSLPYQEIERRHAELQRNPAPALETTPKEAVAPQPEAVRPPGILTRNGEWIPIKRDMKGRHWYFTIPPASVNPYLRPKSGFYEYSMDNSTLPEALRYLNTAKILKGDEITDLAIANSASLAHHIPIWQEPERGQRSQRGGVLKRVRNVIAGAAALFLAQTMVPTNEPEQPPFEPPAAGDQVPSRIPDVRIIAPQESEQEQAPILKIPKDVPETVITKPESNKIARQSLRQKVDFGGTWTAPEKVFAIAGLEGAALRYATSFVEQYLNTHPQLLKSVTSMEGKKVSATTIPDEKLMLMDKVFGDDDLVKKMIERIKTSPDLRRSREIRSEIIAAIQNLAEAAKQSE